MRKMFVPVRYARLNSRQKESYNYQKISGVLADYGYVTIHLSDDWNGADFLAHHISGETLRIQLKSRMTLNKKYCGRDLWICFPDGKHWYLFPHDEVLKHFIAATKIGGTASWGKGGYSFPYLAKKVKALLAPYELHSVTH